MAPNLAPAEWDNSAAQAMPGPWPGSGCAAANCHEHEITADGRQVKVWSSRYPENGFVLFDRDEWDRHIAAVKAGELDSTVSDAVTTTA